MGGGSADGVSTGRGSLIGVLTRREGVNQDRGALSIAKKARLISTKILN